MLTALAAQATIAIENARLVRALQDRQNHLEAQVTARTAEIGARNIQLQAEIAEREQAQALVIEQQRTLAAFEERESLGRELHDGLGQLLGYINIQAQATEMLLQKGEIEAARTNLQQLALAAREAYAQVRENILGLRTDKTSPPSGFYAALRTYADQIQAQYGLTVVLRQPATSQPLFAEGVEEQVLRIIQEALTNAGKHAQASRVEVAFSVTDDQVQVSIADDGVGFTARPSPPSSTHFGLTIMRERAEQVGGQLEIQSAAGEGTRVVVTVPRLKAAQADEIQGLRVLLADDHPLFLDGLRNLLMARGVNIVGTARDGYEALEKARALRPDIVVLDLNMPRCDGLAATRAIKAELPEVKVALLTVSEDDAHLFEALKSGASGYLLKSLEANAFCALLAGLMRGEAALAPGIAERLVAEFARSPAPAEAQAERPALTPRQLEILRLVAKGLTYKEIGAALHLSEKTIKYHMGQILERLHLENRAQAIAYLKEMER